MEFVTQEKKDYQVENKRFKSS